MIFLAVLLVVGSCECLKILGLFPHAGKSHFDAFEPLLKKLAETGHEMTVVSHFPQKKPLGNYKDISLRKDEVYVDFISVEDVPRSRMRFYEVMFMLEFMAGESCGLLRTEQMKSLARTEEKFDLVLIEMFNSDCFLGFAYKFNIPFIGISSCLIMPWTNFRFASPWNPAYIPVSISQYSDQIGFFGRVENFILNVYSNAFFKWRMLENGNAEARRLFGEDLPDLGEIALNVSLLLVNTHFSLNRPRPAVPNIIEVGGMFLKDTPPNIPKNIDKWINESKNGVIYFSMGSMIKGHSFPADTRRAFLKAFARLPQRVLWKWENESLPEKPDNVMIQKWMPQFDILCHPNVKAYISHGGLLGTTEAVHCGVPMVVMPQYGDQFVNAAALEASGGGVILDFKEATEETIYNSLRTILEPSFNDKMKRLSAAFRDRPMSPLDTAVYWVEYVARHNGAHHMKTKAVGMPWYQYLLLDVIVFLIFVIFTTLALSFYCLRTTFRLLLGGTSQKVKTN